jgi:hypothetical protein
VDDWLVSSRPGCPTPRRDGKRAQTYERIGVAGGVNCTVVFDFCGIGHNSKGNRDRKSVNHNQDPPPGFFVSVDSAGDEVEWNEQLRKCCI